MTRKPSYKYRWDNRKSKAGAVYPEFKHKLSKEFLWIHGCHTLFGVVEELKRRGLTVPMLAHDGEVCHHIKKVIHDEGISCVALLRACARNKDLCRGTRVHNEILKRGILGKCTDALVTMYAKCGAVEKAKELLDIHKSRDAFSWTALIAAYAHKGQGQDALNCFERMQHEGLSPDAVTFSCVLKACGSIGAVDKGEQIHDEIARQGLLANNIVLGNALVDMYAKCGSPTKAQRVLGELPVRDVISWNALIAGYAQQSQAEHALNCFEQMQCEGLSPDAVTFLCILKACGGIGAIDIGEKIHEEISRQGLLRNDIMLGTALVDMYAKCGALGKAYRVLKELPVRDVVSWSAIIAGYAQQGQAEKALDCFDQMQCEGLSPDVLTLTCILKACGDIGATDKGEGIHDVIARHRLLQSNSVLGNALVDMYARCGALAKARQVFEDLPVRDVVAWSALITGYSQQGHNEQALDCFEQMQCEGLSPNVLTFLCVLKACGSIGAPADRGENIHYELARHGFLGNNVVVGTALVDMYAKCGDLGRAQQVLDDLTVRNVFSWTALIMGYAQQGQADKALNCFKQMQREGFSPDAVTFLCILKACGSTGAADKGEQIHDEIARQGLLGSNIVLGNALIDMYAKCGALAKAQQVLEELPIRNVVSWSALIAGYAQQGQGEQALNCFERMQHEGFSPNAVTFLCILKACGSIGAADKGEQIYDEIARQGLLGNDSVLGTALVDMYAKCGSLAKAQQVVEELPVQSVVSWNALMTGYAQQGQAEQALNCFEWMQQRGLCPDGVTLLCILKACGSMGLVDDAQMYFVSMSTKYGIKPDVEHYSCLVDVFGRAGYLEKAVGVIQRLRSFDLSTALSLLGACRKWGDANVGRWAFELAVQIDRNDAAAYALMANIYAAAGMQEDAEHIEDMRIKNIPWNKPAQKWWMDTNGSRHSFLVRDMKHTQINHVYTKTGVIGHKSSEERYSSNLHWVFGKFSNDAKNDLLCGRCEELALAYSPGDTQEVFEIFPWGSFPSFIPAIHQHELLQGRHCVPS